MVLWEDWRFPDDLTIGTADAAAPAAGREGDSLWCTVHNVTGLFSLFDWNESQVKCAGLSSYDCYSPEVANFTSPSSHTIVEKAWQFLHELKILLVKQTTRIQSASVSLLVLCDLYTWYRQPDRVCGLLAEETRQRLQYVRPSSTIGIDDHCTESHHRVDLVTPMCICMPHHEPMWSISQAPQWSCRTKRKTLHVTEHANVCCWPDQNRLQSIIALLSFHLCVNRHVLTESLSP